MKLREKQKKYLLKSLNVTVLTGMLLSAVAPAVTQVNVYANGNDKVLESSKEDALETEVNSQESTFLDERVQVNETTESTQTSTVAEITETSTVSDENVLETSQTVGEKETKESNEEIDLLVSELTEKIKKLSFDDVLNAFGGRNVIKGALNAKNHVTVPEDQADLDKYQLDESFNEIKHNADQFVLSLIQNFKEYQLDQNSDETTIENVQKLLMNDLYNLLLTRTYLNRWYTITINDQTLADQLFFIKHKKESSNRLALNFASKVKADPKLLDSENTADTFRKALSDEFEQKEVGQLLESFIKQQTGREDYNQWLKEYFPGKIIEKFSKYSQMNQSTWYKLTQAPNYTDMYRGRYLLPLLTLKNADQIFILNTSFVIGFSSSATYGSERVADKQLNLVGDQLIGYIDNLIQTGLVTKEILENPKKQIVSAMDSESSSDKKFNYLDKNNQLTNGLMTAVHSVSPLSSSSGAFAKDNNIQFVHSKFNQGNAGTFSHELFHSLEKGLMPYGISSGRRESVASRIHNWKFADDEGIDFILYETNEHQELSLSKYSNKPDRFQKPKDLQEYFGGSVGLVYALNQALADYVLELPISEQVGYIRQWNEVDNTIKTCSAQEIQQLNLKNVNDLIEHNIGIFDKSIPDGEVEIHFSNSYYSLDAHYFTAQNNIPLVKRNAYDVQFIDELLSLEEGTGWEKVIDFYSDKKGENKQLNDLQRLQKMFDDDQMDFQDFRKQMFQRYGENTKAVGLRYDTYEELKQNFANHPTDFRKAKLNIYAKYMEKTDEFKESIYLNGQEVRKPFADSIKATDSILTGKGDPKATITAKVNGEIIAQEQAQEDGRFELPINPQKVGTKISVTQRVNGIESSATEVIVSKVIELKSNLIAEEVSKQLGIASTHEFGKEQLEKIKKISFSDVRPTDEDLSDISKLEQLTNLELYRAGLTKLDFIANLTHLKLLFLDDSKVEKIDVLANLVDLEQLSLQRNRNVVDLTPLQGLSKLTKLWAASNKISDLSPLSELNLTFLDINNNEIKDIDPLGELEELATLKVSGNQIGDITLIKNIVTEANNQTIMLEEQSVTNNQLILKNVIQDIDVKDKFGAIQVKASHEGMYDVSTNDVTWNDLADTDSVSYEFSFDKSSIYSGKVEVPVRKIELEGPTVDPVIHEHKFITGKSKPNAMITAKTDGKVIGKGLAESDGTFRVTIEQQLAGMEINVTQTVSDVESAPTIITVVVNPEGERYNEYELGYWRSYGFILEGKAGMNNNVIHSKESVQRYVELVNTTTEKVESSVKAQNTDWYEPGNYDGYQAIITNEMIDKLTQGNYRIQVMMIYSGIKFIENLTTHQALVYDFIGDYQDAIIDLGTHNVNEKAISFTEGFNQVLLNVAEGQDQVNVLNSRVNVKGETVADLWIASGDYDYQNEHTKHLVIKDANGKEVYNETAPTWNIKKTFNKQVKPEWEKSGVQAVIPKAYQGKAFTKEIQVKDKEEAVQVTTVIPQEYLK